MIDEITGAISQQMAAKLDDEIKGVLDKHLGAWSFEEIQRRCKIMMRVGSPIETLYLDGRPILEIHPIELETVRTETGFTLRATRNVRPL